MILLSFSFRLCRHLAYSPWVNFRLTCAQSLSSRTMLSAEMLELSKKHRTLIGRTYLIIVKSL